MQDSEVNSMEGAALPSFWCSFGVHKWGPVQITKFLEEIPSVFKKSTTVRVSRCGRCALVKVESLT